MEERRLLAFDATIELHTVVANLAAPVTAVHAGDGSGRLFIAEQGGRIQIVQNGALRATEFLDISSRIVTGGERGLLGLAFHPDYAMNGAAGHGRFYVYYSAPATSGGNHDSVVAEYRVSAVDLNRANPLSGRILMRFAQPFANHNGGDLKFGPDDGLLYIATGDGGSANDTQNNAQNRSTLLGKILRIDVLGTNGPGGQYGIPADNPFINEAGVRPEIFAYGFRNPFRMAFDDGENGAASPDRLFVGDVGQGAWEEVDLVVSSGNYGWRIREGAHDNAAVTDPDPGGLIDPIAEYPNPEKGRAVIGGFVYRGEIYPSLQERYVFGDLTGRMFVLEETGGGQFDLSEPTVVGGNPVGASIFGFGEDESGELYMLTSNSLRRITVLDPAKSDKVGVYQVASRSFLVDANGDGAFNGTAGGDLVLSGPGLFANVGDLPLVGDWNGDSRDEIGFYRPRNQLVYLDRNGNGEWDGLLVDQRLGPYGIAGDQPLVGDWDGDGDDQIGVYRTGSKQFIRDLDGDGVLEAGEAAPGPGPLPSGSVPFNSDDQPVIGDWDGDGDDDLGVFRPRNNYFYLDRNANGVWDGLAVDQRVGPYGNASDVNGLSDRPVTGDWNGNAIVQIGLYDAPFFRLDANTSGAFDSNDVNRSFFGDLQDIPVIGNWTAPVMAMTPAFSEGEADDGLSVQTTEHSAPADASGVPALMEQAAIQPLQFPGVAKAPQTADLPPRPIDGVFNQTDLVFVPNNDHRSALISFLARERDSGDGEGERETALALEQVLDALVLEGLFLENRRGAGDDETT